VEDRPLLTLSRYRDRLASCFGFQFPPDDLLSRLCLKEPFFQLARLGGFPVPKTLLLHNHHDLCGLCDLRLPLCVKPNGRSPAYVQSFKKAYRIANHADAQSLCKEILDAVGEVIVQEWIEGSDDSIYFSLCYLGEPTPVAFTGRKGRSWPPQIGVTASCWAAPEVAEELEDLTIRFFEFVGVKNGFASMEYKRDQRDGRFVMVEPTVGRTDGQVEISALCGINLCHVAYCDIAGLQRPPLKLDPTHVWRDEFKDFLSARISGTSFSYPPGHRVHNAYWRWGDPAPALFIIKGYAKRALKAPRRAFRRALARRDVHVHHQADPQMPGRSR
jgi:predicted ATP-grasp superfamily ATP-dependent carboligase